MSGFYTTSLRRQDQQIFQKLKPLRQLFDSYIVCALEKAFVIIDQHAAHERIQFEKLNETWSSRSSIMAQYLVQPLIIPINTSRELQILSLNIENLRKLGFKSEFGPENTLIVRSVPTFSYRRIYPSFIQRLREFLLDIQNQPTNEQRILKLIACHSAIKANRKLSKKAMRHLINDLSLVKNPWTCPHGRPIIREYHDNPKRELTRELRHELDKQFKRT